MPEWAGRSSLHNITDFTARPVRLGHILLDEDPKTRQMVEHDFEPEGSHIAVGRASIR
jgi:hypothetical protein